MLSSLFGKKKPSPAEDETPAIPGPSSEEGFEVVDPSLPYTGLYPGALLPARPAPPAPSVSRALVDQSFHYLQGVPFSFSRQLQLASNKDIISSEIGNVLAFLTSKLATNSLDYDFSVEKSVLREY